MTAAVLPALLESTTTARWRPARRRLTLSLAPLDRVTIVLRVTRDQRQRLRLHVRRSTVMRTDAARLVRTRSGQGALPAPRRQPSARPAAGSRRGSRALARAAVGGVVTAVAVAVGRRHGEVIVAVVDRRVRRRRSPPADRPAGRGPDSVEASALVALRAPAGHRQAVQRVDRVGALQDAGLQLRDRDPRVLCQRRAPRCRRRAVRPSTCRPSRRSRATCWSRGWLRRGRTRPPCSGRSSRTPRRGRDCRMRRRRGRSPGRTRRGTSPGPRRRCRCRRRSRPRRRCPRRRRRASAGWPRSRRARFGAGRAPRGSR